MKNARTALAAILVVAAALRLAGLSHGAGFHPDERHIVSGDSNYGIGFHEAELNRPREWGVAGRVAF